MPQGIGKPRFPDDTETAAEPIPDQDTIVIERREVIAEIHATPYGDLSMVHAAFASIADYLDRIARESDRSATLEFVYHGRTFHASVDETIS